MDRVNGADYVDIGGGRRGFRSQNLAAGTSGTEVTAAWLNALQENILKVIEAAGLVPDINDWDLLWKAIQFGDEGRFDIRVSGWVSSPPGSPTIGDRYIVIPSGTGAFAGHDNQIAIWTGSDWLFDAPLTGLIANYWSGSRLVVIWFDGTNWYEWLASTSAVGPVKLATAEGAIAGTPGGALDPYNAWRIKRGGDRVVAAGTANALSVTPVPALDGPAYRVGLLFWVQAIATNTGAATLDVSALGAAPIRKADGSSSGALLSGGEIAAGETYGMVYDGAAFRLLNPAATQSTRGMARLATPAESRDRSRGDIAVTPAGLADFSLLRLKEDTTFYVRSDGSDTNDGLANTSGSAFQTLQGAYDVIRSRYFANGYEVTLQLGTGGTYAGLIHDSWPGTIIVRGNPANPSNYQITAPAGFVQPFTVFNNLTLNAQGCQMLAPSGGRCAWSFGGNFGGNDLQWVAAGNGFHFLVEAGGTGSLSGNHQLFNASEAFISVTGGGRVYLGGAIPFFGELIGGAGFINGFVSARESSAIMLRGGSFAGSAVGRRYVGSLNSIFNTQGGGANFFLGDTAGELTTGAQYA